MRAPKAVAGGSTLAGRAVAEAGTGAGLALCCASLRGGRGLSFSGFPGFFGLPEFCSKGVAAFGLGAYGFWGLRGLAISPLDQFRRGDCGIDCASIALLGTSSKTMQHFRPIM